MRKSWKGAQDYAQRTIYAAEMAAVIERDAQFEGALVRTAQPTR
jgi:hypothetical protein